MKTLENKEFTKDITLRLKSDHKLTGKEITEILFNLRFRLKGYKTPDMQLKDIEISFIDDYSKKK